MQMCECRDPACPTCKGTCPAQADWMMHRVDMDDTTGTPMCDKCAVDAAESGLYRSSPIPRFEPVKAKSPYQERSVTICKIDGFDDVMNESQTAFQNAIGYLAEWNMWANRFTTVRIGCGLRYGQPELIAVYRTKDGDHGYTIGAVWDAKSKRFTFHS